MPTTAVEQDIPAGTGSAGLAPCVATSRNVGELLERFEMAYRDAHDDPTLLPWGHEGANPSLVTWLNVEAPTFVRPGARVAVVGCGLGDDAATLCDRGYEVTAFDVCEEAIASARRRHPHCESSFVHADLFDLPARFTHRFDLVVEAHTLQSMPPGAWAGLASAMANMLSHRGVLLAITLGRGPAEPIDQIEGPPFPLTCEELIGAMSQGLLELTRAPDEFMDGEGRPIIRAVFARP